MTVHSAGRALVLILAIASSFAVRPALGAQSEIIVGVRHNMHATLITPDGPGPFPGVLILHTSGGLEDADLAYAKLLANEGYVCLVPAFMAAYGLSAQTRQETFTGDATPIYADLVSALDILQNNPKVQGSKLAAIGFSNGGYFAVWLALTNKVQAGVGYYGAYSGAGTDIKETRFAQVATASSAPILILHGANDSTVPVEATRRLAGILENAHAPYEIQVYPDTGHLFDRGGFNPKAGKSSRLAVPNAADTGDLAADGDAWTRTLHFLQTYLKPQ
jgi:carboxymethylenebutenolidase